jgi:hypothetical protein
MPCHRSNSAISLCHVLAITSLFFTSLSRLPVADGSVPLRRRDHLNRHRRQWWGRGIPSFIRDVRGGGIVTAAAASATTATTGSSSSSTRASSDIIGNEPCIENELVALFPASDANILNDTNYTDSDPVNVEEKEDAAIVSITSATTNADPDMTPPKTIQYVIKKDGTMKPFEKDKVRKAKGE